MPLSRPGRVGVLLTCLLALGLPTVPAATPNGFTSGLTDSETKAAGLEGLTATERDALDRLVEADLARARDQRSSLISGSLAERHSPESVRSAGLDQLTPEELSELDRLVVLSSASVRPAPRERPRLKGSDVLTEEGRLRLHGGASFTVGGGSGGSFHGASTWVSYFDPKTGLGLSIAYSRYSGDGWGGYYGPGYPLVVSPVRDTFTPFPAPLPAAPGAGFLHPADLVTPPRARGAGR